MKFEDLPNEIFIECFEYLNACDLFYSFDQLNTRFYQLIRHIRLYLNLENVKKSIFDQFCTTMSLDPTIKTQIYSLYYPLHPKRFQSKQFFSLFSSDEFINVEKYGFIISTLEVDDPQTRNSISIPLPKTIHLRTLSVVQRDYPFDVIPSIINLTIDQCNSEQFVHLLKSFPQLKYFRIEDTDKRDPIFEHEQWTHQHLKQLVINYFRNSFDDLKIYMKFVSNLESLSIFVDNEEFSDAERWEELITSCLPKLKTFRFVYFHDESDDLSKVNERFSRFRNDFWQEHQWFTEYTIREHVSILYTIPYPFSVFILLFENKNSSNYPDKNFHIFNKVTDVFFDGTVSSDYSEDYYLPNVTSLLVDISDQSDVSKYFDYLNKNMCLFNLKHLNIEDASEFLNISFLQVVPQLMSLSINWKTLVSRLNDVDLCNELKPLIKRLNICKTEDEIFDDSFYRNEQFRETFQDLEHLTGRINDFDQVIDFLQNFPRLSTLNLQWESFGDPQEHLSRWNNELRRFNVIYDIDSRKSTKWNPTSSDDPFSLSHMRDYWNVNIRVWIGKTT